MGCCREKRPSEKTLDTVFSLVRSLDVQLWTGEKYRVEDVEENVSSIKRYLDELVTQFKQEVGYTPTPTPTNFSSPPNTKTPLIIDDLIKHLSSPSKPKEWHCTPIVPETPQ